MRTEKERKGSEAKINQRLSNAEPLNDDRTLYVILAISARESKVTREERRRSAYACVSGRIPNEDRGVSYRSGLFAVSRYSMVVTEYQTDMGSEDSPSREAVTTNRWVSQKSSSS